MTTHPLKVFISYKWEDEAHNRWVERLASDLRAAGIDAILDIWEVRLGSSFTDYMTSKIKDADVVLFIMTSRSVQAVEAPEGKGGAVKFEIQMATSRRTAGENMRLIGIYREGEDTPAHLRDHRYADFRDESLYGKKLKELIDDLLGRDRRPPLITKGQLPSDPQATYALGEKRYAAGDYKKAIGYFDQAIRLEPEVAAFYFSRGNCRHQIRECAQAVDDYNQAIELESGRADYYYARGRCLSEGREFRSAIQNLTRAIRLAPLEPDYYHLRAECYHSMSEYDRAIKDFTRAIKLAPDDPRLYYSRSVCLQQKGDFDQATKDHDRAIRLDNSNPELRGKFYLRLGEYVQAIEDFNRAITLSPNDAWLFFWRGMAYRRAGRLEAAEEDFMRASNLGGETLAKILMGYPMDLKAYLDMEAHQV
jgi:tetratricopeptide (TPR) repeat protein